MTTARKKTHKDSGFRCLVKHYDHELNALPQCIQCENCGKWIQPDKMNEECCGIDRPKEKA